MKDEFIYDRKENLIYRKRAKLTDEEIEELMIEEAYQQIWWEEQEKKRRRK